jgi:hypothetical protein
MTAYYHDHYDDDNGTTVVATNAIVEAEMRDIVRRGILSATANDDDGGIDVAAMIDDAGGSSPGPAIAWARLASVAGGRRGVAADASTGRAGAAAPVASDRNGAVVGVSVGLSTMAVVAAALLAFVLAIRRRSRRSSNSREEEEWGGGGVEEEEGGGGAGYHNDVGFEDGENRGDESTIIPSRRGRGGGRRYGGSNPDIVNKAGADDDDDDDDEGDEGEIGCISLDLAMSGYHPRPPQRQPRRQWLSWSASSATEVSRCDTEATPRMSNRTAARGYGSPPMRTSSRQRQRLPPGNMARETINECENDDA